MDKLVELIVDVEANRRLDTRHFRMDLPCGGSDYSCKIPRTSPKESEPLLEAYFRSRSESHLEVVCYNVFRRIPKRQGLAVLIKYLKEDRRRSGPWSATYDNICKNIAYYRKILGWETNEQFDTTSALKACASRAEKSIADVIAQNQVAEVQDEESNN